MTFDRSRFMKNWWRARTCHECKFLHIGRKVDHNHCDLKPFTDWREDRVNGHSNYNCYSFLYK